MKVLSLNYQLNKTPMLKTSQLSREIQASRESMKVIQSQIDQIETDGIINMCLIVAGFIFVIGLFLAFS